MAQKPCIYLAVTRFNDVTLGENERFRCRMGIEGCMYGTPNRVSKRYPPHALLVVLEMNNEHNRIEGLGVVKNCVAHYARTIYSNPVFNTYTYGGKFRLSRDELVTECPEMLAAIERMVFTSRGHVKRQYGITVLADRIFAHAPPGVTVDTALGAFRRAITCKYRPLVRQE